ncbi:MAG: flagellar biosynthetic protein FliQ [Candidatus Eremiobacteraeota bacterium]|nr:flagellar biosynthetic protein FliQ [Candidatus Eremiobacteraeota bacterium]MBV8281485.1 flagellar biosynthetic protein FliQ [Candidatus Eremiobacteraeota bacterium]
MARALQATLALCVPVIAAVAITGVAVGALQTIVQVQDQNVSFLPKLLVIAFLVAVAGVPALALLVHLFAAIVASIPRLIEP